MPKQAGSDWGSAASFGRSSGGIAGSSGNYVHPVYKNMNPKAARAADKVVAKNVVVNKGKPEEIIKSLKLAREDIISLSKVRGSRTSNSSEKRKIYRGSRG